MNVVECTLYLSIFTPSQQPLVGIMYNNIGVPNAEKDILDRIAEAQNAAGVPETDTEDEQVAEKTGIVVTDATPPSVQNDFSASERRGRPKSLPQSSSSSSRGISRSPMLGIKHNGIPIGAQRSVSSPTSGSRSRGHHGVSPTTGHRSMSSFPQSDGFSIDPIRKGLSQTVYEREILTSLSEKVILLDSCRETCKDLKRRLETIEESHKALLDEIDEQKQASGYNDHSFGSLLESCKEYNLADDLERTKEALSKSENLVNAQEGSIGELEALLKESNADLEKHRASRKRSISAAMSRHHGRSSSVASSRVHRKTSSIDSVDPGSTESLWYPDSDLASSTFATPDMSRGRSPASPEVKRSNAGVRLLKDLLAKTLLMRCQLALAASKIPLAEKLVRRAAAAAKESQNMTLHGQILIWKREAQQQMRGYQSTSTSHDSRGTQASIYEETTEFDDTPQSRFGNIDLVLQRDTPPDQRNRTFGYMHGSSKSFGSSRSLVKNKPAPLSGLGLGIDFGPGSKPELTPIRESPTGSPTPRAFAFIKDRTWNKFNDAPMISEDLAVSTSDEDEAPGWSHFHPTVNQNLHMPRLGNEELVTGVPSHNSLPVEYIPTLNLASSPPNDLPEFEAYRSSNAIRHWQSQVSEAHESVNASVQSTPGMSASEDDYKSEPEGTPITPADETDEADEVKKAKALWG